MMVKLNMKKVSELEAQYTNDGIYLSTLQRMIDIVMTPQSPWDSNNSHYTLAVNTLRDLGVIEGPKTMTQQLNS
jgi:hypothetical protein